MQSIISKIIQKYFIILFSAVALGVLFSDQVIVLSRFSRLFLGAIFFLYALKINVKESGKYLLDRNMILVTNLFMLIFLPLLVYYITLPIFPELSVAALILAAMPTGMTVALLSDIVKGKPSLALVLTISTSIFAPFTIPFVLKFAAGTQIALSFLEMFLTLAKVIFIPILLANIIKFFWDDKIKKVSHTFVIYSTVLLGLLIMVLSAKQSDALLSLLKGGEPLIYLLFLFVLFGIFHILGYYIVFWRSKVERVTIALGMTYMDFTLAIFLVDEFFTEPNIVIPVLLSMIPWVVLLLPFRFFARKLKLV